MTHAELEVIQRKAEAVLAPYGVTELGDGVRIFAPGIAPDDTFQLATDCLRLVRLARELARGQAKYEWLLAEVSGFLKRLTAAPAEAGPVVILEEDL